MGGTQLRRRRPWPAVAVVALLLLAAATPVTFAGNAGGASQPETDNTLTHVAVHANGTAEWTITIRTRLDTDERVSEYEAFQEGFRANTSRYLDPFRARMTGVVANAANATGREMTATGFTASTTIQEVPRRWGVVSYRFVWSNFAATAGDELVVGDVFQGGFFLAANDTLEIEAPDGYAATEVEPSPASEADGRFTWVGREDFTDGHPRVVFAPASTGDDATTEPGARTTTAAATSGGGDPALGVVLGGALLLGLGGVGLYALWRRDDRADALSDPDARPDAATVSRPSGPDADVDTDDDAASGSDVGTDGEPTSGSEIVTDAERVERLLADNDGRLRQADIAEELDWSPSKTSRVVADMVKAGTVEKLQLGRENVIDLAGGENR